MSLSDNIGTILILDIAFAMATGFTGIHGLIVDLGAEFGAAIGIEPLFDAHAGHDHGASITPTTPPIDSTHVNEIMSNTDPEGFAECFAAGGTTHEHGAAMACMRA
jgi:hypothetical protein